MTQAADPIQQALSYMRHQASKGLDSLAALMERSAEDWQRCLQGMTEAQAGFQPPPTGNSSASPAGGEGPKWCAKEVIGHFLASERSLNRQVAGLAGVEPPSGPAPAVRAMGVQSTEDEGLPLADLRQKLMAFFQETGALIASLERGANLDQTFPHPVFGQLNPKEWMAFHRVHAMDHIQQIENVKAAPGYPAC
ncbi:MAG: DinB family protein [Chloroflexi bacterium]|nr:DinB family protein [Chloroflexota bacterium]